MEVEWKTVELWTLPADEFLAKGDVGVMPWVPLMQFDGPPEPVLERCAARIEREAPRKDRTDMMVIAQVMAGLRFPGLDLLSFFGGEKAMIESPLIQKVQAEAIHKVILDALKYRFGSTPRNLTKPLREIIDEKQLRRLNLVAIQCADLDEFREALGA